jgi:hypothetical protein
MKVLKNFWKCYKTREWVREKNEKSKTLKRFE